MNLRRFAPIALLLTSACAGSVAVQPDRAVFSLDSNYQRYPFIFPIETTFDRTVATFKDAGYKFDVLDRATGQISGTRGHNSKQTNGGSDKGLKFYALVMPGPNGGSQLAIKIVQTIEGGIPVVKQTRTEIIVTDAQMYQYIFRRVETAYAPMGGMMPLPEKIPAAQPQSDLAPVPAAAETAAP
jgi:hypothetical protein